MAKTQTYETTTLKKIVEADGKQEYDNKQIKLEVLKIGKKKKHTGQNNTEYTELLVADETHYFIAHSYNKNATDLLKEGKGIIVKNFKADPSMMTIRYNSVIGKCGPPVVPDMLKQTAIAEFNTEFFTIEQIKENRPGNRLYNLRAVIRDPTEAFSSPRKQIEMKNVNLEDDTGIIPATLWKQLSKVKVSKGDTVEIRGARMSLYQSDKKLELNAETTQVVIVDKLKAAKIDELKIDSLGDVNENDTQLVAGAKTFTVPTGILMAHLKIKKYDEAGIEAALFPLLPLHLTVSRTGDEILNIV